MHKGKVRKDQSVGGVGRDHRRVCLEDIHRGSDATYGGVFQERGGAREAWEPDPNTIVGASCGAGDRGRRQNECARAARLILMKMDRKRGRGITWGAENKESPGELKTKHGLAMFSPPQAIPQIQFRMRSEGAHPPSILQTSLTWVENSERGRGESRVGWRC